MLGSLVIIKTLFYEYIGIPTIYKYPISNLQSCTNHMIGVTLFD